MGILKDKVVFCKKCGSYHRNSYECSPVPATKKAEVVPDLADIETVNETVISVASREETVLPEAELVKDPRTEEEKQDEADARIRKANAKPKTRTRKPSQKSTVDKKEDKPE
jgi:hypothetical protein